MFHCLLCSSNSRRRVFIIWRPADNWRWCSVWYLGEKEQNNGNRRKETAEKMTEKGIKFAKVKLETISWVGEGNENSEFVKREGWQNSWARKEDVVEKSAGAQGFQLRNWAVGWLIFGSKIKKHPFFYRLQIFIAWVVVWWNTLKITIFVCRHFTSRSLLIEIKKQKVTIQSYIWGFFLIKNFYLFCVKKNTRE